MISFKEKTLQAILEQGLLPLFFHPDKEESIQILRTLYQAGIRIFEFTNRGPEAKEVFEALRKVSTEEMPDLLLGIGTIKTVKEAKEFLKIGADFIVSPIINSKVGALVHQKDKLWIPGCMTPTEIFQAQKQEALLIKLFPANILGPGYMAAIRELFKGQHFIPTGGVELEIENLKKWFQAGVSAVGMGSKLIDPNHTKNLLKQTKLALKLVAEAK